MFDQIDQRMTDYVATYLGIDRDEARRIQKAYFRDFGTTMNGMMRNHGMDPEPYLQFVHDIDHSPVTPDPELAASLAALPGRRLVFTNGSKSHAERVMLRLGITDLIDDVHDIKASHYVPKPQRRTYELLVERTGVDPASAAMFEDIARNLVVPHELGMVTVLVRSTGYHADAIAIDLGNGDEPHVDHVADDLSAFLHTLAN